MRHVVPATPQTVHVGSFDARLPTVLTIDSGDEVVVETFTGTDVRGGRWPPSLATPAACAVWEHLPPDRHGPGPHLLTGPIAVRGAMPCDVLEVAVESIELTADVAWVATLPGWGVLPPPFDAPRLTFVPLDRARGQAAFPPGSNLRVPLRPFFGCMGVAPAGAAVSSVPPGAFGGNMDLRELTVGTRLLLPVQVQGAMLSVGDGHAAQGDGEVCTNALETHLCGVLRVTIRRDVPVTSPVVVTPEHLVVLGFGPTLDDALHDSLAAMVRLLVHLLRLDPHAAYKFCSVAAHCRVTQAVNVPSKGVHVMLPWAVLGGSPLL
ncbi:MAG TPA: acetamidase/formamidase family protein [Tepidisphaeraceae bacterium]|nr:acetamidase/formamidase family protein [Tepidisphaeraceae bacterium]